MPPSHDWPGEVYRELVAAGVRLVGYVPDAGQKRLIELCQADKQMRAVPLTTEEEGIGLAAGAWLGGMRSVLLMQSSGVGNIINALGLINSCRLPFFMIATMRGEWGEFNPWQVAMGKSTQAVLEDSGVYVYRADSPEEVPPTVLAGAKFAYQTGRSVVVLIGQRVIGTKNFNK